VEKERKRKVTIRKLPHEGYDIGVEFWKDTPLEEVLETLSELGFERIQERIDGYEGNVEAELIEDIFEKFMSISRDYGKSVKNIEEFYERWIDVGFNIVDLKNIIEKMNKPPIIEGKVLKTIAKNGDVQSGQEISSLNLFTVDPIVEDNPHFEEPLSNIESEENPPGGETKISSDVAHSSVEVSEPLVTMVIDDGEGASDSRSTIVEEDKDSCMYCGTFKDIGTMVCPHCGRPLNL
jgi:hypothetical protein